MAKVVRRNLEKAIERLDAARLPLENGKYEDSVNRAYHSMYHSTMPLLQTEDVSPKTHKGLIGEFGKRFGKTREIDRRRGRKLEKVVKKRGKISRDDEKTGF